MTADNDLPQRFPNEGTRLPQFLRTASISAGIFACLTWGLCAIGSYPIIVIADSDLGIGAMQRVRDAGGMFSISLGLLIVSCRMPPFSIIRVAIVVGLLGYLASYPFESSSTSYLSRWPLLGLAGLILVAECLEKNSKPGRAKAKALLALALPFLLILTDHQGRVFFGQIPSKRGQRSIDLENLRTSVSLMDLELGAKAVSPVSKLKAHGTDDGTLIIENLDGGPARKVPPTEADRMLQVLSFSPDGKTLAVADNNRMYEGSVITVWDVVPGQPPRAMLRHTLRGHTHWAFSLDFFTDGKTLVSANGDNTVRFWNLESGQEMRQFGPHHNYSGLWDLSVDCLATSPDGRTFATWGCDGRLKIWDKDSQELLRAMETKGSIPCALAFTPDGQRIIATDREGTSYFDLSPGPIPFSVCLSLTAGLISWMFLVSQTSTGVERHEKPKNANY